MERLNALDAQFLHLEDDRSPMHIAGLCTFEGPVPDAVEVDRLVNAKLRFIPRYRRRIRYPPLELGRPVWVDDPHFDLTYHLRRTAVPAPGDDATVNNLMGRLMAQLLDRDKPLWEAWIIEGLPDGRWGFLSKIHHAMVDGISGTDLMASLLDTQADAELPDPEVWRPEAQPSGAALVLDAWKGLAEDARGTARRFVDAARDPRAALPALLETGSGLLTFARELMPARPGSIQGTIGRHRSYAHTAAAFADVQKVRKALGGSVNDVVLAIVSGGYRDLLIHRGEKPETTQLRSLVPVSVRGADEQGLLGNRVSAVVVDLPVAFADATARLHQVSAQMHRLKGSHMAEAGAFIMDVGDLAPPFVVGAVTRLVARMMHALPQRSLGTVTTNVPGPREPLFFLGRRMLDWFPYVPIYQGLRVGTAILSYAGRMGFGVTTDNDTVPDAHVVARGIDASLAELLSHVR